MENGDRAHLLNVIDEVEKLRTWKHDKVAPFMEKLASDIRIAQARVDRLEAEMSKTGGLLTHWREGLILLLLMIISYYLLKYGVVP